MELNLSSRYKQYATVSRKMCIMSWYFATTDSELPRRFDFDAASKVHQRELSEMGILTFCCFYRRFGPVWSEPNFLAGHLVFNAALLFHTKIEFSIELAYWHAPRNSHKKSVPTDKFSVMTANQGQLWMDRILPVATSLTPADRHSTRT